MERSEVTTKASYPWSKPCPSTAFPFWLCNPSSSQLLSFSGYLLRIQWKKPLEILYPVNAAQLFQCHIAHAIKSRPRKRHVYKEARTVRLLLPRGGKLLSPAVQRVIYPVWLQWSFSKGPINVVKQLEIIVGSPLAVLEVLFLLQQHITLIPLLWQLQSHTVIITLQFSSLEISLVYKKRRVWKECSALENAGAKK